MGRSYTTLNFDQGGCFGVTKLTNEAIAGIIGSSLAVAIKKDEEGFITFWYADHINKLNTLREKYKDKDLRGGKKGISELHQVSASFGDEEDGDLPF